MSAHPVDLFYSYSHKDEELRDQLDVHLAMLKRRGVLRTWYDRRIAAGAEWRDEIATELERADIILLLISADFIASDYCFDVEMKRALDRHHAREACVVPIILRACDLEEAPFGALQALPTDRRPVTTWEDRDRAWVNVVDGIRLEVNNLTSRAEAPAAAAASPASPPPGGAGGQAPAPVEPGPEDAGGDVPDPRAANPPAAGALLLRAALAVRRWFGGAGAEGAAGDAPHSGRAAPPAAGANAAAGMAARPSVGIESAAAREEALVQQGLDRFAQRLQAAFAARNATAAYTPAFAVKAGATLLAIHEQKRVLWVDDDPAGNANEVSALLAMQIDVQQVTSTQAALDALRPAPATYDLVISDWNRVPRQDPLTPEGVRLLRLMRGAGIEVPVVYYHGMYDDKRARARSEQALREGAVGATTQPGELFALTLGVLADGQQAH